MELAKRTGLIVIIVIFLTGILACFDLYTKLNIKSKVYGYFYSEPEVIHINDFEYDISSLLFTNTGAENQYIAKATTKAVKGFDKNKNYTATINNNLCSTTTNTDYINVTFTNQFNSISDSILMTDELNIKINFYTDGTQLVFVTNNGEQAVKLWSSYISKHGFKIKLVESSYTSSLSVEGLRKITYSIEIQDDKSRILTFYDYCPLNTEYQVKSPSELLNLNDDIVYAFYGFTLDKSELDELANCDSITGSISLTDDTTLYGLLVSETSINQGVLTLTCNFDSFLTSTTSYGVIKITHNFGEDKRTYTLALKEKTYTISDLSLVGTFTIEFITTKAVLNIEPITFDFSKSRTKNITINVYHDPSFTGTVTST